MARVSTIVTNFQAGEFSPRLEGRIDLQKYNSGCQKLENMLVFPQGGATRRPGTKYIGTAKILNNQQKVGGDPIRLIPFEYSDEQAYVLELGHEYMRFYTSDGVLLEAPNSTNSDQITAATNANPVQITTKYAHGFSNGDRVYITGVEGMTELNNREFQITNSTSTTFTLLHPASTAVDGTGFGTFVATLGVATERVGKIHEISTPWGVDDLDGINYTQSADVVYFAHKDYQARELYRINANFFSLGLHPTVDGPYLDENTGTTTVYASAQTGTNITLTASGSIFTSSMVGGLFRLREILEIHYDEWAASTSYANNATVRYNGHVYKHVTGSTQTSGNTPPVHLSGTETYGALDWEYQHDGTGYIKIKTYVSGTSVRGDVEEDENGVAILPEHVVGSSNATTRWSEGAWSDRRGWPRALAFYEERLYFAGTTHQPQTIFGSKTADFRNHTPGTEDDDAINITIASDKVNVIKHMIPGRFLQILTTSSEFTLSGGTGTQPVTPTNVNVLRETTFGTSDVRPLRAGSSTIMVQGGEEKVKEVTFDLDTDGLVGRDLTVLAEHLGRGGFKDMVWQQEPELVLWFVHNDGTLIGLSYDPQNNTIGWHRHPMGDSGLVESVAGIPSGAEDQVFLSVKRAFDAYPMPGSYANVRHIVVMDNVYFGSDVSDAFYVDSGLTYDGSATTTVTGLGHLEGKTVQILADGSAHADKVVSNGAITLDRSASTVHVGYSYDSKMQTLRLEGGADDGVSQGKIKRIHGVTVRFLDTVGAEVGPDEDNLDRVFFRDSSMNMDEAIPMFDGDKEVTFPSGYDNDARVFVRQTQPLPMTILAVMRRSNTFDA